MSVGRGTRSRSRWSGKGTKQTLSVLWWSWEAVSLLALLTKHGVTILLFTFTWPSPQAYTKKAWLTDLTGAAVP